MEDGKIARTSVGMTGPKLEPVPPIVELVDIRRSFGGVRALKGVSQAAMSRRRGTRQRWWTTGGSQRSLRGAEAIAAAVEYVKNQDWPLAEIVDNRYQRVERSER